MLFRKSLRSRLQKSLVVVSMKSGGGYRGILFDDDRTGLQIIGSGNKKLTYIPPNGQDTPVDGWVFIPAAEIEVIQVIQPVDQIPRGSG